MIPALVQKMTTLRRVWLFFADKSRPSLALALAFFEKNSKGEGVRHGREHASGDRAGFWDLLG